MKYITAMYLPDFFGDGRNHSNRFCRRARRKLGDSVIEPVERWKHNRSVLGEDLTIFIDERLKISKEGRKAFRYIVDNLGGCEIIDFLPSEGFWLKKWHISGYAYKKFNEPILWMDFSDVIVKEKLNEEEEAFLKDGREIILEWEVFRCFGPPGHFSDGRVCKARTKQPQTSIYVLSSTKVSEGSLATGIDHDQISLMHYCEKAYGIFQDVDKHVLEKFSSRGLFRTLPKNEIGKLLTNDNNIFKPKIFHKCGY